MELESGLYEGRTDEAIGVLREHEVLGKTADLARNHGVSGSDALQLENQIWRHGRVRGQAAEAVGGGERKADEAAGRGDARRLRSSEASVKKW